MKKGGAALSDIEVIDSLALCYRLISSDRGRDESRQEQLNQHPLMDQFKSQLIKLKHSFPRNGRDIS